MGYVSLVELAGFVAYHSSWRVDCIQVLIAQLTARLLLANHFCDAAFVVALFNSVNHLICLVPDRVVGDVVVCQPG